MGMMCRELLDIRTKAFIVELSALGCIFEITNSMELNTTREATRC
jgi:hypothetical protein